MVEGTVVVQITSKLQLYFAPTHTALVEIFGHAQKFPTCQRLLATSYGYQSITNALPRIARSISHEYSRIFAESVLGNKRGATPVCVPTIYHALPGVSFTSMHASLPSLNSGLFGVLTRECVKAPSDLSQTDFLRI